MEIAFGEKLWGVILAGSLFLAAGITLLMYYRLRSRDMLTGPRLRILMLLRFLSVFLVTFLLASPLVKSLRKITRPPQLLMAVDHSRSMTGLEENMARRDALLKLAQGLQEELNDRFEVIPYSFGAGVTPGLPTDFTDKRSDYSRMLQTVYDNHFNENIGALVIIGDGTHNQGENPLQQAERLPFPVYTLATGDTTPVTDARIVDLRVNRTAFAGNLFPLEADLRVTGTTPRSLLFSVSKGGRQVFSQMVNTRENAWFTTLEFTLPADGKGLQYYTATIESLPGEQNLTNNSWPFVINILENKQKILILSAGAHPDAGALKNALEQQVNYEVTLVTGDPYPSNFNDYNLIVLNQMPTAAHSLRELLEDGGRTPVPLLVILGAATHLSQLNAMGLGITITPRAGDAEEAQMSPAEGYTPFTLSDDLRENLNRYPPLKVPFAAWEIDPSYQVLGFQRIRNLVTSRPLIATGSARGRKTGLIAGEGLWRWRLYDYTLGATHDHFNELCDKLVQYLALRDNEDRFIVSFKPVYAETDPVEMTAEVYNEAYELINSPEVTIQMTDSTGREFSYIFDRSQLFYRLDAGVLPPGRYAFTATTTTERETRTETGEFAVIPVNVELADLRADHGMLYRLSFETGGKFFTEKEAPRLAEVILHNSAIQTTSYFQSTLYELLNLRILFFLFLFLLSTEWFLRKFWGIY